MNSRPNRPNGTAASSPSEQDSPLRFPCDFPLKVMGDNSPDFISAIHAIVQEYAPDYDSSTTTTNTSRSGRYISLTLTVNARSRAQLDAIYTAVTAHPLSRYVL